MALNALKCNHLASLGLKGLSVPVPTSDCLFHRQHCLAMVSVMRSVVLVRSHYNGQSAMTDAERSQLDKFYEKLVFRLRSVACNVDNCDGRSTLWHVSLTAYQVQCLSRHTWVIRWRC